MAERKTARQLREERNITQMALAVQCGVSIAGIQGIDYGWSEPRVRLALKIAAALGVTVEEIDWTPQQRATGKDAPRAA